MKSLLLLVLAFAIPPIASAAQHTSALEPFYGVWIGPEPTRNVDIAIWRSRAGIEMTLRNLGHHDPVRITLQFDGTKADTLALKSATPPTGVGENYWAEIEGARLIVFHSRAANGEAAQVSRYEYSIYEGQMTLNHVLSRNGDVLRTETVKLRRSKVVM